ncbi:NAD(P)-dependent alcohol dehydrogenase [Nesterenkonia sp. HG001]|uniref:NAD(P)-dependent alcohol dehydrogenase n=1 Tax=Nesterenkonia sp. HG001 TaxID=2983207 RepID=UPI002AC5A6A0|nr:NAD(P)-dependent alcohol dehydrogenase [Nesterenkonia sp. HG001]MDZ5078286.1 NAD(P)-dependent alcohol dehydrogenase [Nesterenkonia sp. HG001]
MSRMRAAVLRTPGDIVLEERRIPVPGPGDVLVRVTAVGICGSDVHYYRQGRIGPFVVEDPLILGHESAGVIAATGDGVDFSRLGERVSVEPQRIDWSSPEARAGRYNLDPRVQFFATPPVDGAFAEYVTIPSMFAHRLPDEISAEAGALLEPLSVAVAATRKARLGIGDRVLVTGAGPIGLILTQVARALGASEVVVTDVSEDRLRLAETFGATRAVVADTDLSEMRADVLLEASGAPPAIHAGLRALGPAGRAVLIGMGADDVMIPLTTVQNRELEVTGVFRYANTWPTAIELVRSGRVDLDRLVTGRFSLEQTAEALTAAADPRTLKAIVHPS